jgi:AcrR family transcriptional regulator
MSPSKARGQATRAAILDRAVDLGSVDGLEGLTIGRLASELEMSKSGLFRHFGSKRELQLAAVERAREIFVRAVVVPAADIAEPLARLRAQLRAWLDYFADDVFAGGCFFANASAEFDDREGPVKDAIAGTMREWADHLEALVRAAVDADELDPGTDPAQLTFELVAIGFGANWQRRLHGDRRAPERAAEAFDRALAGRGAAL